MAIDDFICYDDGTRSYFKSNPTKIEIARYELIKRVSIKSRLEALCESMINTYAEMAAENRYKLYYKDETVYEGNDVFSIYAKRDGFEIPVYIKSVTLTTLHTINIVDGYVDELFMCFENDLIRYGIIKKEENEMPTCMGNFSFSVCAVQVPEIKKVIFSGPCTIILWCDGTKTVVKCHDMNVYDKWSGMALCICKKLYGKKFKKTFQKWDGLEGERKLEKRLNRKLDRMTKKLERMIKETNDDE